MNLVGLICQIILHNEAFVYTSKLTLTSPIIAYSLTFLAKVDRNLRSVGVIIGKP